MRYCVRGRTSFPPGRFTACLKPTVVAVLRCLAPRPSRQGTRPPRRSRGLFASTERSDHSKSAAITPTLRVLVERSHPSAPASVVKPRQSHKWRASIWAVRGDSEGADLPDVARESTARVQRSTMWQRVGRCRPTTATPSQCSTPGARAGLRPCVSHHRDTTIAEEAVQHGFVGCVGMNCQEVDELLGASRRSSLVT
jgi:hypothetical protein